MSPARVMNYTETVSVGFGDATSSITQSCTTAYPSEWTRPGGTCTTFPSVNLGGQPAPRYTCISNVASAPVTIDFASSATEFANSVASSCNNGVLMLDGREIARSDSTCITTLTSGVGDDTTTTTVDSTQYKNLSFHTIPSLYHHTSPTDEEIAAAMANRMTPSLPVDMVRYVEFVTPK